MRNVSNAPAARRLKISATALAALVLVALLGVTPSARSQSANSSGPRPKLVVLVVVDQMRADYLERFAAYETGGLHFFATRGADFLNANYQHTPTETCLGHSILLSGRNPAHTGIVANDWYDRDAGKMAYCVDDPTSPIIGGQGAAVSPRNLIGENFSDWIQAAYPGSHVYAMALKDRSAILMAGHKPQGAFWYSTQSGQFVSSRYYGEALPQWVSDFNARGPVAPYAGKDWMPLLDANSPAYHTHQVAWQFPHHMPDASGKLGDAVYSSPFGDEVLESFAESAVTANHLGEKTGASTGPDVLELGFSSNDAIGHAYGPDSPEIADEQIRLDRTVGKLMDFLNQRLGEKNVLWVLSGDHGAEPTPEAQQELDHNAAAQRIPPAQVTAAITAQLNAIFHITGDMHWFASASDPMLYFDRDELKRHNIPLDDARQALVEKVKDVPGVEGFYDPSQADKIPGWIGPFIRNSVFPARSGDVYYLVKEWTLVSFGRGGTSHSDPWPYDTHVPLILAGWRIQPAQIPAEVHIADLAPTLASLLGVKPPADEPLDGKSLAPQLKLGK